MIKLYFNHVLSFVPSVSFVSMCSQEMRLLRTTIENLMEEFAKCGPTYSDYVLKLQAMLEVMKNSKLCENEELHQKSVLSNGSAVKVMDGNKNDSSTKKT